MNHLPLVTSINVSDNDRRLLIVLIIVLLLTLALAGAVGYLIKKTMEFQAKRVNIMCTKVLVNNIIIDAKHYKKYANAKSSILYFKQSFIGVIIGLVALITWIICSAINFSWGENIFYYFFNDLFFIFGVNETSTSWSFLNITIHSIVVVNNGGAGPQFVVDHIPYYVESLLFIVSICWILVATQAFVSRYFAIIKFANDAGERTLKNFTFNNPNPTMNQNSTQNPPNGQVPPQQ